MDKELSDSLVKEEHDPLIKVLNKIVVYCVKFLAILIVLVIVWSLVDVVMHMYTQLFLSSPTAYNSETLLTILGSFLSVLIAIEIFLNIVFYLKKDAIHVPLVLATALTAISRKIIILDFNVLSPLYIFAIAAVIIAVGISYWLVTKKTE